MSTAPPAGPEPGVADEPGPGRPVHGGPPDAAGSAASAAPTDPSRPATPSRSSGWPRPGGWVYLALVLVTAGVTLWAASVPGGYFTPSLLAGGAWVLLGAVLVAALAVALTSPVRRARLRRTWPAWLVLPVAATATVVLVGVDAPLRGRLWISAPAAERFAQDVAAGRRAAEPARVGTYDASRVQRIPGGIRFVVRGAGFLGAEGFAYSPDGPPRTRGEDTYRHLWGSWYRWSEDF